MNKEQLISEMLLLPAAAIDYHISQHLLKLFPDKALIESEGVAKISELTDGFSFAYLKELFLSSKMRWIAIPQRGTMEEVMTEQVGKLREQMVSVNMDPMAEMPEELEGLPPMFGPMMARGMRFQRRILS